MCFCQKNLLLMTLSFATMQINKPIKLHSAKIFGRNYCNRDKTSERHVYVHLRNLAHANCSLDVNFCNLAQAF